ncbi:MAG: FeoB-associated Cys-rich membrane protein [Deltaproteobacteria bacterium]|nr:FeoB-associated Cys-rich membrane protein [Deltaproteobacteria bacterium]
MAIDYEMITGIAIVGGAALLMVRQIRKELAQPKHADCGGGCSGCAIGDKEIANAFDEIARKIESEKTEA